MANAHVEITGNGVKTAFIHEQNFILRFTRLKFLVLYIMLVLKFKYNQPNVTSSHNVYYMFHFVFMLFCTLHGKTSFYKN